MRKIAICGTASSTREDIPKEGWEIWTLSHLPREIGRSDRHFEIHQNREVYPEWLPSLTCPIYMLERQSDIPTSITYPIDRIGRKYLNSTVSYMLALAISENPDVIGIFGVDLIDKDEYLEQRPCAYYWLGVAEGRGIQVVIPDRSALLRDNSLYGKELWPLTINDYAERLSLLTSKRDEYKNGLLQYEGALQECQHHQRIMELRSKGGSAPL